MDDKFYKYRNTCPNCRPAVKLEWEQLNGMRLIKEKKVEGRKKDIQYYETRCTECEEYFNIKKP